MKLYSGEHAIITIPCSKNNIKYAGITVYSLLANSSEFHICLLLKQKDFPSKYNDLPYDILVLVLSSMIEITWSNSEVYLNELLSINDVHRCIQIRADVGCVYTFNYGKEMVSLYYRLYGKIPAIEPYDLIISLTTWKGRISHPAFPQNLLSLLNQETQYNFKVVLVLSKDELGGYSSVPATIRNIQQAYPNFEILWTDRNTKALKNYNPTAKKYQDLPIVVVGDDTIYDKKLVETVYTTYLNGDKRACYCAKMSHSSVEYQIDTPWRIRLFPPHAMRDLDDDYFDEYFYGHNDLFNALRLHLNNTPIIVANWNGLWHKAFAQEVRLRNYHCKTEHEMLRDFLYNHPEYNIHY